MEFGLIGERLGHSFSKVIHEEFSQYDYALVPLTPEEVTPFFEKRDFQGINVTIPYKTIAMEFCAEIDEKARAIGAVNTIINKGGSLYGYNTDYYGFAYLLDTHRISLRGKSVLILGDGGTARTIMTVAQDQRAVKIQIASRTPGAHTISYQQAQADHSVQIIINASPVGMYPNNGEVLLDVAEFLALEAVVDVVYNPLATALILQTRARGITAVNGLEMLVAQAKQAAELFTGTKLGVEDIERVHKQLWKTCSNITLIGMPGSGKSSLGKVLAEKLGKTFVDIDERIEARAGKTIVAVFAEDGEAVFRALEKQVVSEVSRGTGQVISTGGGVILDEDNTDSLKQNGPVLWIDCPVEMLSVSEDRPLARDLGDLMRLEGERQALYQKAATARIAYHSSFQENIDRLRKAFEQAMV